MKQFLSQITLIALAWLTTLTAGRGQGLPVDLAGVGATIIPVDGELIIRDVLPKMGAGKAGAQPKDVITQIDGKWTHEMKLTEALGMLRGEPGSEVVLTLKRAGAPKPITIIVERVPLSQFKAAQDKQKEREKEQERKKE
jgi:C-terminal processing protease CtpA/Prc